MKDSAKLCLILSSALFAGAIVGCEEGESAGDATKRVVGNAAEKTGEAVKDAGEAVGDATGDAMNAVSDAAANAKDAAVKAAEDTLAEIKPQIDAWAQKAAAASPIEKPVMENLVKGVKDNVAAVETKLTDLKNAAADTWEPISKDLSASLTSLKEAAKAAAAKFGA